MAAKPGLGTTGDGGKTASLSLQKLRLAQFSPRSGATYQGIAISGRTPPCGAKMTCTKEPPSTYRGRRLGLESQDLRLRPHPLRRLPKRQPKIVRVGDVLNQVSSPFHACARALCWIATKNLTARYGTKRRQALPPVGLAPLDTPWRLFDFR